MTRGRLLFGLVLAAVSLTAGIVVAGGSPSRVAGQPGVLLEDLTWVEAEKVLTPDALVVVPIGAESKEHGPHLKLRNDWTLAQYLAKRVLERSRVVVAPTVNYHYYPAFVEYPGSTTLRLETARDLVIDVCRSLARFGPRRFYALNTGVSTVRALDPAVAALAAEGITLRYTNILTAAESAEKSVSKQEGGTHADEIETSMMLYIDPASVDMRKAVKDYHPASAGGLTRDPKGQGSYSASGIFGDPTLATREKGRIVVEALVSAIAGDIEQLRAQPSLSAVAAGQEGASKPPSDLDAFMARVLERRDENWQKLHDYILSETERFSIAGPGKVTLYGFRREFSWYVRDGYLIRSPVRFDGVTISEPERRRYEEKWLSEEKAREEKRAKDEAEQARKQQAQGVQNAPPDSTPSLEAILSGRVEPRFVSEAYFLKFKFDPGNYYLVGRETLDGRDVIRIEYYPTRLFEEERPKNEEKPAAKPDKKTEKERQKEREMESRINRGLNKVALVTLWIEPTEYQIVRYTFDNVDFGFLPGRWLVRVDDVKASMTMSKVLDGVWLPSVITMEAGISAASGAYDFTYGRQFYDHKKAEVSARIRVGGEGR